MHPPIFRVEYPTWYICLRVKPSSQNTLRTAITPAVRLRAAAVGRRIPSGEPQSARPDRRRCATGARPSLVHGQVPDLAAIARSLDLQPRIVHFVGVEMGARLSQQIYVIP